MFGLAAAGANVKPAPLEAWVGCWYRRRDMRNRLRLVNRESRLEI
jgi:hypothetical protein